MKTQPDRIFILHITDLHFGDHLKDENGLVTFYNCLADFKAKHIDETFHLVVTGDFIDRYAPEKFKEIDSFKAFIDKVRRILNITNDRVCFCLGNHDKNLAFYKDLIERITKSDDCAIPSTELAENIYKVRPKQKQDDNFIEEALKVENAELFIDPYSITDTVKPTFRGRSCSLIGTRIIDGIVYLVLNSSWLCNPKSRLGDNGNLTLGINTTRELLTEYDQIDQYQKMFTIGLMHHSFGSMHLTNFHKFDSNSSLSSGLFERCDLILNGHEHGEIYPSMADISTYIFRAGSTLAIRDLKGSNSFSFIEVNFLTKQISKLPIYLDGSSNKWHELDVVRLEFPAEARSSVLNHKIQINQYFLNLKSFILKLERNETYIPADKFLLDSYDNHGATKTICDIESLREAETLSEYIELHSNIRTKVLHKLSIKNYDLTFKEPLDLVT